MNKYLKAFDEGSDKFMDWFQAQFGPEPAPGKSIPQLKEEIRNLLLALRKAENTLREKERWEDHRRAALYAWVARGRKP